MKITKREFLDQHWKVGDVIGDRDSYYLIVQDGLTNKYRLLSIQEGNILVDEYDTIYEMKMDCGDLNPVVHAELILEG